MSSQNKYTDCSKDKHLRNYNVGYFLEIYIFLWAKDSIEINYLIQIISLTDKPGRPLSPLGPIGPGFPGDP